MSARICLVEVTVAEAGAWVELIVFATAPTESIAPSVDALKCPNKPTHDKLHPKTSWPRGHPTLHCRMQKWEYKVVKRVDVSENGLNELGADGWELMNFVLPQCNIPGSFDEIDVELVLRRPVQG